MVWTQPDQGAGVCEGRAGQQPLRSDLGRLYEKADGEGRPTLLEKAVAARPSDDRLTVALSRLYAGGGDLKKAEAVLTRRLAPDRTIPPYERLWDACI